MVSQGWRTFGLLGCGWIGLRRQCKSAWARSSYSRFIAERGEKGAVILTAKSPFSEWTQVIHNVRLCKAMFGRLSTGRTPSKLRQNDRIGLLTLMTPECCGTRVFAVDGTRVQGAGFAQELQVQGPQARTVRPLRVTFEKKILDV